ncbi:fluoride efflux transporter CrcB [Tautonia rosea]|uniref:fluoride efflux transporter CrcB n=1 Tax=Tautonia rosea TaxID=2728037 RepID=UPI0014745EE4|nr:fluoride efflux transporter CrcB [Tautonia rosea]
MEKLIQVGLLSLGGACGVNMRFWFGLWISRWSGHQFPWATLLINLTGSFAIGFLTVILARWLPHPNHRIMLITGFIGGYTTYSSFALESLMLWERGERLQGVLYVGSTVLAGFLAVILGVALARGLTVSAPERAARSDPLPPNNAVGTDQAPVEIEDDARKTS